MSYGTLIRRRHPMRVAASAMLDADHALDEIQRQFNRYPTARLGAPQPFTPRLNAVENETEYLVTAELPGVEAENLSISVDDGVLTIKGILGDDKHAEAGSVEGVETVEGEEQSEVSRADKFERRVRFNGEIDDEAVKARYKNGLLTVTIPKPEVVVPEVRSIPVEVS